MKKSDEDADAFGHLIIERLLAWVGEDPKREGLLETPSRAIQAWDFWTSGYGVDPLSVLKTFEDGAGAHDDMVFQGNISVYSHCEHHLAPFFGVAHIGYIPNGRVVGLSKLARVTEVFARRLQTQERLTREICDALKAGLNPQAVGVVLRCRHLCIESRGVAKAGTITYTSALEGGFFDHGPARAEFLQFVARADAETGLR